MPNISDYIDRLRAQGYTNEEIQQALIQAGYAQGTATHATPHAFWPWAIAATVLAIAIGTITYFALQPTPITLTLRPDNIEAFPGTEISWTTTIHSTKELETLTLTHELVDTATTSTVTSTTSQTTTAKKQSIPTSINIPQDIKPGRYLIRTSSVIGPETMSRTFTINILTPKEKTPTTSTEPTCNDGMQNQGETGIDCGGPCAPCEKLDCNPKCDDKDPCTQDICENGKCIYTQTPTCCGNAQCEPGETSRTCPADCTERPLTKTAEDIINEATAQARIAPERATTLCSSLSTKEDSDTCFQKIATILGQHKICTNINAEDLHDKCLIQFTLDKNDYAACELVKNKYLKNSCHSLKNLRTQ